MELDLGRLLIELELPMPVVAGSAAIVETADTAAAVGVGIAAVDTANVDSGQRPLEHAEQEHDVDLELDLGLAEVASEDLEQQELAEVASVEHEQLELAEVEHVLVTAARLPELPTLAPTD